MRSKTAQAAGRGQNRKPTVAPRHGVDADLQIDLSRLRATWMGGSADEQQIPGELKAYVVRRWLDQ